MKTIFKWIKDNPNRVMFLAPILLVAGISISHVVSWYNLSNPINWSIYLSFAIEIGAMTALVAATNKIKGGVWAMFGLVTFIQMIGNIFYSYKEIDVNGELFKSWVELTLPIWELFGTETTDVVAMKRWLAFLEGGLLPIISLTSLHFFIKYENPNKKHTDSLEPIEVIKEVVVEKEVPVEVIKEVVVEKEVPVEVVIEKEVPIEVIKEIPVEVIVEKEVPVEIIKEVPVKYFINDEGDVYDEDGYNLDPDKLLTTTTTTDDDIRRLTYTKPI